MSRKRTKGLIVNATCIGARLDGVGVYALSLVHELALIVGNRGLVVVLNRHAAVHIRSDSLPPNVTIRWAPGALSPDHGFVGHLLRLVYANLLSVRLPDGIVFSASPFEAMFFRRQQVITVHDVIPLQFPESHPRQYWYFRFILGRILRRVSQVLVPSQHTHDLVRAHYGVDAARITVIPNGIRRLFQSEGPAKRARARVILFTGWSRPTKNVRRIVEAFRMIQDRVEHQLVIAGHIRPGSTTSAEGDGRVVYTGYVSDAVLRDLYTRADLFVFPTLVEGFGLPPLEAMACGCPVIASRCGSLPEVCGDAAYYVDERDSRAIADGMYRVLTDDALRSDLTRRGLEWSRQFDWGRSARRILAILDDAATSSFGDRTRLQPHV